MFRRVHFTLTAFICFCLLHVRPLQAAPRIVSASAHPTPVQAGQPLQLSCELADPEGPVARVVGNIREVPYFQVPFKRQTDGTWTVALPVPRESQSGTYHIDLVLMDAAGQPVQPDAESVTTILAVVTALPQVEEETPRVTGHSPPQTRMVPMRDGVRLAADVYPGPGRGPWPVIFLRTPYGRQNASVSGLDDYAIVVQDVRGRFGSEGYPRVFLDDAWGERQDGIDTVEWILAEPWCNGRIGTMGESALGIAQSMLAGARPRNVLCQRIEFAAGSLYDIAYPGGIFAEALWAGWLKAKGWPEEHLQLVLSHPTYDDSWQALDANTRIQRERISIPAVHIGGWYDIFADDVITEFQARSKVDRNQWLVMGPWPHEVRAEVGELVYPSNAVELPVPARAAAWFDCWLKGVDTGIAGSARVHYYVMGACGEEDAPGNEWRTADSWPIPARRVPLYLAPDRELAKRVPSVSGTLSYPYNPADPVPTRGGRNLQIPAGPMDQRPLDARPDVLTFTTPTLTEPLEVTGPILVKLWASSSAPDTAFAVKVCDVYRDGRAMLVTDGILRAACRRSRIVPAPIKPGQLYEFLINAGSTSIIFNRGHRIRLDISSSNYPRFAAHPNVRGEGKPQVARQKIYFGGRYASALILPVVNHRASVTHLR
jgi:hypothetical protein